MAMLATIRIAHSILFSPLMVSWIVGSVSTTIRIADVAGA